MGTGRGILVGVVSRCVKPQQTRFDQEAKAPEVRNSIYEQLK